VWRTVKRFLTPRWLALHVLVWAAAVAMVLLGRWQLDVSNAKHFDLQNFGYSLQWWAFSAFAIALWVKLIRDAIRGEQPPQHVASGELVVRPGSGAVSRVGPAHLVAQPTRPGEAPVVYRGYVMPQSSATPVRSEGDELHASYNDYLWQLNLADGGVPEVGAPRIARPDVAQPGDDASENV
jgi:DNA-binding transcriptional regulator of glucitol operon